MKRTIHITLFFYFLFLFPELSFAQSPKSFDFIGIISLSDASISSYRINFRDSLGIIKGYSITDINGQNATKALIEGTIDKKSKSIEFKETKILTTRSKAKKEDFCFVNAKLKLSTNKKGTNLKGTFVGNLYNSKSKCAKGAITLIGSADLIDLLNEIKENQIKNDTITSFPTPLNNINRVANNDEITYEWQSDTIIIQIWDENKIDGDQIDIVRNNKVLLSKYYLQFQKKTLKVLITSPTIELFQFIAVNEGRTPPNTGRITLIDKYDTYQLNTNLKTGESFKIKINKKQTP